MREYFMYSTNDNVVFNFNKMKDRFLLVYNNKQYNAVNIENKYRQIQNPNILENISQNIRKNFSLKILKYT